MSVWTKTLPVLIHRGVGIRRIKRLKIGRRFGVVDASHALNRRHHRVELHAKTAASLRGSKRLFFAYFQALDTTKPATLRGLLRVKCDRPKRVLGGLGGLMDTQHEPFSGRPPN